ncbi:hypothetical protein OHB54_46570 (plasmid) [Streptomyces sp. NBC_01007]|nr:hypothetical protein OHB54_46570 [Streptomyces sp. NBC_01007]
MSSDRSILLLLVVFVSAYVALRHPVVREPVLVGVAVGTFAMAVLLAK